MHHQALVKKARRKKEKRKEKGNVLEQSLLRSKDTKIKITIMQDDGNRK
jgi:hypothetical protein